MREKKRREVVLKLHISMHQACFIRNIRQFKDQIWQQYKSITTLSICINAIRSYINFLYEQVILRNKIYVGCSLVSKEKHSLSPVLAIEAGLTCLVWVKTAGLINCPGVIKYRAAQHHPWAAPNTCFTDLICPFSISLPFLSLPIFLSPSMSLPNSFPPPVQLV